MESILVSCCACKIEDAAFKFGTMTRLCNVRAAGAIRLLSHNVNLMASWLTAICTLLFRNNCSASSPEEEFSPQILWLQWNRECKKMCRVAGAPPQLPDHRHTRMCGVTLASCSSVGTLAKRLEHADMAADQTLSQHEILVQSDVAACMPNTTSGTNHQRTCDVTCGKVLDVVSIDASLRSADITHTQRHSPSRVAML